jgi:hypothetical protein
LFLCASKDRKHNQAVVLCDLIEGVASPSLKRKDSTAISRRSGTEFRAADIIDNYPFSIAWTSISVPQAAPQGKMLW